MVQDNFLHKAYITILGRAADNSTFNFWKGVSEDLDPQDFLVKFLRQRESDSNFELLRKLGDAEGKAVSDVDPFASEENKATIIGDAVLSAVDNLSDFVGKLYSRITNDEPDSKVVSEIVDGLQAEIEKANTADDLYLKLAGTVMRMLDDYSSEWMDRSVHVSEGLLKALDSLGIVSTQELDDLGVYRDIAVFRGILYDGNEVNGNNKALYGRLKDRPYVLDVLPENYAKPVQMVDSVAPSSSSSAPVASVSDTSSSNSRPPTTTVIKLVEKPVDPDNPDAPPEKPDEAEVTGDLTNVGDALSDLEINKILGNEKHNKEDDNYKLDITPDLKPIRFSIDGRDGNDTLQLNVKDDYDASKLVFGTDDESSIFKKIFNIDVINLDVKSPKVKEVEIYDGRPPTQEVGLVTSGKFDIKSVAVNKLTAQMAGFREVKFNVQSGVLKDLSIIGGDNVNDGWTLSAPSLQNLSVKYINKLIYNTQYSQNLKIKGVHDTIGVLNLIADKWLKNLSLSGFDTVDVKVTTRQDNDYPTLNIDVSNLASEPLERTGAYLTVEAVDRYQVNDFKILFPTSMINDSGKARMTSVTINANGYVNNIDISSLKSFGQIVSGEQDVDAVQVHDVMKVSVLKFANSTVSINVKGVDSPTWVGTSAGRESGSSGVWNLFLQKGTNFGFLSKEDGKADLTDDDLVIKLTGIDQPLVEKLLEKGTLVATNGEITFG